MTERVIAEPRLQPCVAKRQGHNRVYMCTHRYHSGGGGGAGGESGGLGEGDGQRACVRVCVCV